MRKWIAAVSLVPVLTGCSMFAEDRAAGYSQAPAASAEQAAASAGDPAAREAADAAWANRGDKAQIEAAIKGYEEAVAQNPGDIALYERLSRANYFLADSHLRTEAKPQEVAYNKSIEWGERCMGLSPAFRAKIDAGEKAENAMSALTVEYAGCVYWAAAALGKWAALQGFATKVANKDRIVAWIKTVTELDPHLFYGAPDRYWGAYYSIIPGFMGKDLKKSEEHFKKSLALAPNYLGTKVLMAERLAAEKSDRAMFKTLLEEVIAADPNIDPELAPENAQEQAKARDLLAQIDEIVPE